MPTNHFSGSVADHYDADAAGMFARAVVDPTVDFLAALAGNGAALEFGVGTGRVALPLAARGVPVRGIDLSRDMVTKMRAKPGGDAIDVAIGDFADVRVGGTYALVYLVFNTIMNLVTQDEQVACFENAASHLEPGGCFVIEVGVPALQRLPPGETARPFLVSPERVGFDEYDVATQRCVSHHYWIDGGELRTFSAPFRYVWPSELDLMAQLAGLHLRERWGGWDRAPFTSDSAMHVSVWEKPA